MNSFVDKSFSLPIVGAFHTAALQHREGTPCQGSVL